MSKSSVTIRMDSDLKRDAEKLFQQLGLNMTTAFNIFASQAVREQGIPFNITMQPNEETLQAIEEARNGVGMSKTFTSVDELMEDLNA